MAEDLDSTTRGEDAPTAPAAEVPAAAAPPPGGEVSRSEGEPPGAVAAPEARPASAEVAAAASAEPGPAPSARALTSAVVLAEIARLPKGADLARLVHAAAFAAAAERRSDLDVGLDELVARFGLGPEDGKTSHGDALRALGRAHVVSAPERILLGALLARGVALEAAGEAGQDRVLSALSWIGANTAIDPFPHLDGALGAEAAPLWRAAAATLERADEGTAKASRPACIVLASALGASASAAAASERARLRASLRDPALLRLLAEGGASAAAAGSTIAAGELVPPPRGAVSLFLLTVTGILPLLVLGRLLLRFALRLRRPAELRVSSGGVTVVARTELLGRTLRERELHIPISGLTRAAREVRFPRLALYAGIGALVVGTYVGLRLFLDGLRVGSPELLGAGAAVVVLGLVSDYALAHVGRRARGRCRVLFVPRRGRALALADVDPALADAALVRLAPASRAG